jgi:hypothetical protein
MSLESSLSERIACLDSLVGEMSLIDQVLKIAVELTV